jgi:hypothetical protein
MLHVPTVFVIGAGAGADIDMPLGSRLTDLIASKVNINYGHTNTRLSGDETTDITLRRIAQTEKLNNANALFGAGRAIAKGISYVRSIDSYISTHEDNENIKIVAKAAIAQIIMEEEKASALWIDENKHPREYRNRDKVKLSWLSDFFYRLQDGIKTNKNLPDLFSNLTIINFNYDRCVEHFLYNSIQELYQINDEKAADLIRSGLKMYHPYGWLGPTRWLGPEPSVWFGGAIHGDGDVSQIWKRIKTFHERVEEGDELREMRAAISAAHSIVFLGFHFHEPNMDLLTPQDGQTGPAGIPVYSTVYERSGPDLEIIRRQINKVFDTRANVGAMGTAGDCKTLFKIYGTTLADKPR